MLITRLHKFNRHRRLAAARRRMSKGGGEPIRTTYRLQHEEEDQQLPVAHKRARGKRNKDERDSLSPFIIIES